MGSIARILLRQLVDSGALKNVEQHSKQGLYTPVAVAADKVVAAPVDKDAGKGKGQSKKVTKDGKDGKWFAIGYNLKIVNKIKIREWFDVVCCLNWGNINLVFVQFCY